MSKRRMLLGLVGANIMGSLSPVLFADAFAAAGIDGFYHLLDVDHLPGRRCGFGRHFAGWPYHRLQFRPAWVASQFRGKPRCRQRARCDRGAGRRWRRRTRCFLRLDGPRRRASRRARSRRSARECALQRSRTAFWSRCRVASDLEREIAAADGVVNATQVGMRGFPGNPVPISALKSSLWAADVIYTPVDTEFIKAATAKGARVLSGNGMCVHQAVEAFRLFTGITPDIARLHRAFAAGYEAREAAIAKAG